MQHAPPHMCKWRNLSKKKLKVETIFFFCNAKENFVKAALVGEEFRKNSQGIFTVFNFNADFLASITMHVYIYFYFNFNFNFKICFFMKDLFRKIPETPEKFQKNGPIFKIIFVVVLMTMPAVKWPNHESNASAIKTTNRNSKVFKVFGTSASE